jgi:mono/diheme cytochrome c family protein
MKTMWKMLLGFVLGMVFTILVPVLMLAAGMIDVGADHEPGRLETRLGTWARDRAVAMHAPKQKNPHGDAAAIAAGLAHYRENCLVCHGAPGVDGGEMAKGLNPPAPPLDMDDDSRPEGEVFWIIKHGLRMTPMPAFGPSHTDDEIWKIAAFVHHLPDLTDQEKAALQAPPGKDDHPKK